MQSGETDHIRECIQSDINMLKQKTALVTKNIQERKAVKDTVTHYFNLF